MVGKALALSCVRWTIVLAVAAPSLSLAARPASRSKGPYYLRATDGKQCRLPSGASGPINDESTRLRQVGITVDEIAVSNGVDSEWLPAGCVPKDLRGFWKKHLARLIGRDCGGDHWARS